MIRFFKLGLQLGLLASLIACAATQSSLSSQVPSSIDLSGVWTLVEEFSAGDIDRVETQREFEEDSIDGKATSTLGSLYFAEQDFPIVGATQLEIQQDEHSIGILYGVGKYRDLVWGLQSRGEWKLDVGWQDRSLIIKSGISHSRGLETYRLDADNQTLQVSVQIRAGSERRTLRRTFTREVD